MLPELEDYYQRLSDLHDGLKQAIAGLPAEALDWVPGPDMNSLRVLMVHTAGAERYWIGDMAGQQPSGRDRDAEFRAKGLDEAALATLLDDTLAHSHSVLAGLTHDDLLKMHSEIQLSGGEEFRVAWAIMHALEHTALHLGHIQITRQLWDAQG